MYIVFQTDLYILISTDSVYDVCVRKLDGEPYKETDDIEPTDEEEKQLYSRFAYGHNKLAGERELTDSGLTYVILRLPDVIGARDVTNRWWLYQIWTRLSSRLPQYSVGYPHFLKSYNISLVYSPDVASTIFNMIKDVGSVKNEAFNLAWPEMFTLKGILESMRSELGLDSDVDIKSWPSSDDGPFYLYPSGRRGPVDVNKAVKLLNWSPTPWKQAVKDTVAFYESAMRDKKYSIQVDEIIQQVEHQAVKGIDERLLYKTMEQIYEISLQHFHNNHDEL